MAIVQYGVVVTEIKGKIAGQVFQAGNNAYVLRNKGYRKGTSSSNRQTSTWGLTRAAAFWRQLTPEQRTLWESRAGDWPFVDKFGVVYYSGGYQFQVAYNAGRASLGLDPVTVPGTLVSSENVAPYAFSIPDANTFLLEVSTLGEGDQRMQVFASPPMSIGRNGNNVPLKLIFTAYVSDFESYDLSEAYIDTYGVIPRESGIVVVTHQRRDGWPYAMFPTRDVVPTWGF